MCSKFNSLELSLSLSKLDSIHFNFIDIDIVLLNIFNNVENYRVQAVGNSPAKLQKQRCTLAQHLQVPRTLLKVIITLTCQGSLLIIFDDASMTAASSRARVNCMSSSFGRVSE